MNDKQLMLKKENILKKIFNKLKEFFKLEKKEDYQVKGTVEIAQNINETEFSTRLKVKIDTEIPILKIKLDNGEIKAIELTEEQIDELQKIYDKEIQNKKEKLIKLKQST